jgi:hypothetical protein
MKTNDDMVRRYGLCLGAVGFGCCCGLFALVEPVPVIEHLRSLEVGAPQRAGLIASLYWPVVLSGFVAAAMGLLTRSRGGAPLPLLAATAGVVVAWVVSPVRWVIGGGAMLGCSIAAVLGGMVLAASLGRLVERRPAA